MAPFCEEADGMVLNGGYCRWFPRMYVLKPCCALLISLRLNTPGVWKALVDGAVPLLSD